MSLGLGNLLREVRLVQDLVTFVGDALINRSAERQAVSKTILLIPGFMVGDATLYPLGIRLSMAGHRVYFAGIWCNVDHPESTMKRLAKVLRKANHETSEQVVVIGHSLGGIYARELARRLPEPVERVILLGAPLKHSLGVINQPIKALAEVMKLVYPGSMSKFGKPCETCGVDLADAPPDAPETIIYTRRDGVVDWRSCLERGPNVEAVEVRSSHCGLSVSVEALRVITNRLASESSRRPTPGERPGGRCQALGATPPYLRLVKRPAGSAA